MKKTLPILFAALFLLSIHGVFAQATARIGDLPKSEYSIIIYQVFGFHEGPEGFKVTYIDQKNEPKHLFLPAELRSKYRVYRPLDSSGEQNFLIVWKIGEKIERLEWFMPPTINYKLPNYVHKQFGDEDKAVFQKVVETGELTLNPEVLGGAPEIKAPGSE